MTSFRSASRLSCWTLVPDANGAWTSTFDIRQDSVSGREAALSERNSTRLSTTRDVVEESQKAGDLSRNFVEKRTVETVKSRRRKASNSEALLCGRMLNVFNVGRKDSPNLEHQRMHEECPRAQPHFSRGFGTRIRHQNAL